MTPYEQRGGHKPVAPFRPTQAPNHDPACCYLCGRRADGLGFGTFRTDPKFLCDLCHELMPHLKDVVSFDLYEMNAVERAGQRAGAYLERLGKTDLATLTEGEWNFFLREVIEGFGAELRKQIAEGVPF